MKDHAILELRNCLRCWNDINQDRFAVENTPQGFSIGLIDALQGLSFYVVSASELGEDACEVRVPACRRAPAHVNNFTTLTRKVHSKQFQSDVDDSRRPRQQCVTVRARAL
jgi:hypothetical protein